MPITDLRKTVLQIVNDVQRKIGVNPTSTLTETKGATIYLQLLNEIVDELADTGDWLELLSSVTVTAQSSVAEYTISASALVHHVFEIRWHNDTSPLNVFALDDMRRLLAKPSYGEHPRQMAMTGVNTTTGQPKFSVYPVPTTARTFNVEFYQKPNLYTTSDTATVVPFPANIVIKGLYAKALLDENGGEPTRQWDIAYKEYLSSRDEARKRFTTDTGTRVQFRPARSHR